MQQTQVSWVDTAKQPAARPQASQEAQWGGLSGCNGKPAGGHPCQPPGRKATGATAADPSATAAAGQHLISRYIRREASMKQAPAAILLPKATVLAGSHTFIDGSLQGPVALAGASGRMWLPQAPTEAQVGTAGPALGNLALSLGVSSCVANLCQHAPQEFSSSLSGAFAFRIGELTLSLGSPPTRYPGPGCCVSPEGRPHRAGLEGQSCLGNPVERAGS